MPSVNQERMAFGAAEDSSLAASLPSRNVCGSAIREPLDSSSFSQTSGLLDDALHALALAEKRLFNVQRENIGLRKSNEHLMEALEGASRCAVAAVRVAQHDGLTGLPNRLLLIKRLQLAVWHASERQGQLALVFIDLDGFKTVNDRYGHRVADSLLSAVGARIAGSVRAEDLACRYGGDEFVALLSNLKCAEVVGRIAENIRRAIGRCYSINGLEIRIDASVGVAVYPQDGASHDQLLQHADAAMFRDKAIRRTLGRLCEMPDDAGVANQEQPTEICAAG
jgi:diguanylate cyclase (GGDEF)-like protein